MRLLLVHFDRITFSDRLPSTRPAGITPSPVGDDCYENVLVVFACVEPTESSGIAEDAASVIARRWRDCRAALVAVQPFAHLAPHIADPATARGILDSVVRLLHAQAIPVRSGSFGYHKATQFVASSKAYPGSVAYRELPPRQAGTRPARAAAVAKERS